MHFIQVYIFSGEDNGPPLQYSCLENPMDGGAWCAAVHWVTKSWTWLSNFTFHFHALEKEMATHSSVLAWRIPGTGEPSGLLSRGSHRVRHDWSDLAAAAGSTVQLKVWQNACHFCSILGVALKTTDTESRVAGSCHCPPVKVHPEYPCSWMVGFIVPAQEETTSHDMPLRSQ